jgi:hypothetical protein
VTCITFVQKQSLVRAFESCPCASEQCDRTTRVVRFAGLTGRHASTPLPPPAPVTTVAQCPPPSALELQTYGYAFNHLVEDISLTRQHEGSMKVQAASQHLFGNVQPAQVA